jgi:quercetin dioxygenase-like cupin family protein
MTTVPPHVTPVNAQVAGGFVLNQEEGPVRRVNFDLYPATDFASNLVHFSEDHFFIVSRVPAHASGPPAHWHDVDQFFYCVSGQLELQVGEEHLTLVPGSLAVIPAGTPHAHRNEGDVDEIHLELIIPGVIPMRPVMYPTDVARSDWRGFSTPTKRAHALDSPPVGNSSVPRVELWTINSDPSGHRWAAAEVTLKPSGRREFAIPIVPHSGYVLDGGASFTSNEVQHSAVAGEVILPLGNPASHLSTSQGGLTRLLLIWPDLSEDDEKTVARYFQANA